MRRLQVSISLVALLIGLLVAGLLPGRVTEAAAFDIPSGDVAGLIAAINAANADPGADTINLAPSGTYTLATVDNTVDAAGLCSAPNGLPAITSEITINGYGATIRRSSAAGTPSFRIFCIAGPHTGNLTLNGVTVSGGNSTAAGAGIYNLQGIVTVTDSIITNNYAQSGGGGIANQGGTVAVSRSTIRDNASFYYGGGIFNLSATLTLTESAISSNQSRGYRGGGVVNLAGYATLTGSTVSVNTSTGQGAGGLLNWAGVLTLTNSTVSGNTGNGYAGAITNTSYGQLTLANSTLFSNRDIGGAAGGIHSDSGIVNLKNTIVANDSASDCSGVMTVVGRNLLRSPVGACTIVGSGMVIGGDPLLGPLGNNGGPTLTHAPLLGSPVIDAVPLADCTDASRAPLTVDQRGVARPQGAACDIGAVESLPMDTTPPDTTITSGPPALTNNTNAIFTFATSEAGTFQCSLDGSAFAACTSPTDYAGLTEGSHSFQVRATDTAGNIDPTPASSTWMVDTTGPALTVPGSMTVEASSPGGAVITYAASAHDAVDGAVVPVCTPASGSTFTIGTTTVYCTATDAAGNSSSASFMVTVGDTTPPVLTLSADITLDATGPSGAAATFTASATDSVTTSPTVVCTLASGSTFAIGTTTVSCTATDAAGNTTTGTFSVHVNSASEQAEALADAVDGVGSGTSLSAKVQTLQAQIAAGNTTAACNIINNSLLKEVSALTGKKLTLAQAAAITADANRIAAVLGC